MMSFRAALSLIASASLVACAASSDDAAQSTTSDLVNAPRDTVHTWSVGICTDAPNTDPTAGKVGSCIGDAGRCTGSLVAPNLVLTARHCTAEIEYHSDPPVYCEGTFSAAPISKAGLSVTLNESVLNENPTWLKVREIITGPTNNACDDDLALLVLDTSVAAADATPIALQLEDLAHDWWKRPTQLAVVGRGMLTDLYDPKTLEQIDTFEDLTRRYAEHIPLRCISNTAGTCTSVDITTPPSNLFTLSTGQFLFGTGGATGDSGSAMIDQRTFGEGKLPVAVGVLTAGTYGPDGVGNAGIAVRLDRHATWLKSAAIHAAAAPGSGGYALAAWAN